MTIQPKKAFTLIELLIVMAIIGLLMVIGASSFQSARVKARDAKRKSDLETIAKSLEAYVNDHNAYPSSSNGLIECSAGSTCDWGQPFTDGKSTYTAKLPQEDLSNSTYRYESTTGNSFTLYAHLENENDPAAQEYTGIDCGSKVCNYKITSSNTQ